jgi:Iap family predicted aminopeptidase
MPVAYGAPAIGNGKPIALAPEEQALIDAIDYDHAWNELVYLSSLGEKTAGSDEERRAQEYVRGELWEMSFDEILWEEFIVSNWEHFGTTVKIVSNGDEDIPATTYGDTPSVWGKNDGVPYSFATEPDGKTLVAEVVDVGYGTHAELDAAGDITGRVALIHRDDNTQGWPNAPITDAFYHGACAIMMYGYFAGADNPEGIKQDSVFSKIPAISISPNSAAHIQELMVDGPVTVAVSGEANTYSSVKSVNVAAVLEGTTRADEYVVISGHIDTWWWGAFDDCSSIAIMLEMARMFSEARESGLYVSERTLVFCSMGAEETGGPGGTWFNWLVGSYEFVSAHPGIMDGLVLELNIDAGSFPKVGGKVWLEVACEINAFAKKAIADLGYLNTLSTYTPVWSWTDAWSFAAKGGGTAINLCWGAGFDPYYHTQLDTIDIQSEDMVACVLEMTALMAFRATSALVLPLDFVAACDWAAQYLAKEKRMVAPARADIDKAIAALGVFEDVSAALNAEAAELTEMYATAKSPAKKAAIKEMADDLNRAMIDARRIFIPYSMGEGGMMPSWEPFLRPHQHATDHKAVAAAISSLENGAVAGAVIALEGVRSMEWGKYCSREAYVEVFVQMTECFMYWGDDYDQAQGYVDVQGVYLGLKDGSMSAEEALSQLIWIRDNQLLPWFQEDVMTLEWAYLSSSEVLEAVL